MCSMPVTLTSKLEASISLSGQSIYNKLARSKLQGDSQHVAQAETGYVKSRKCSASF